MNSSRKLDIEIARNIVSDGCAWTVYERPVPYRPSQRALVFMSDRVARRVTRYPANWFDLSDDALAELSNAPNARQVTPPETPTSRTSP